MESPNNDFERPSLPAFEFEFQHEGQRCHVCLRSIGFRFFRSIGPTTIWWETNSRISLLIGPNDAGKSNTLKAVELLSQLKHNFKSGPFEHQDYFNCSDAQGPCLSFKFSIAVERHGRIVEHFFEFEESEATEKLWGLELKKVPPQNFFDIAEICIKSREKNVSSITLQDKRSPKRAQQERIAKGLILLSLGCFPPVRCIEVSRSEVLGGSVDFSEIAKKMFQLCQPPIGKNADSLRLRFNKMLEMLRVMLGRPQLTLEFPCKDAVYSLVVCDGGMRLDIERHGTGFQHIVALAFKLFESESPLLLLDEPEVRLHPTLQRKLVEYLISLPDHVSIISTHSPFMLSACSRQGVSLTRLTLDGTGCWTEGQVLDRSHKSLALLRDLGVSASDVLQVRSVVSG